MEHRVLNPQNGGIMEARQKPNPDSTPNDLYQWRDPSAVDDKKMDVTD